MNAACRIGETMIETERLLLRPSGNRIETICTRFCHSLRTTNLKDTRDHL